MATISVRLGARETTLIVSGWGLALGAQPGIAIATATMEHIESENIAPALRPAAWPNVIG